MSCFTFTFSTRNHHLCSTPAPLFKGSCCSQVWVIRNSFNPEWSNQRSIHCTKKHLQTLAGLPSCSLQGTTSFSPRVPPTTGLTLCIACNDHLDPASIRTVLTHTLYYKCNSPAPITIHIFEMRFTLMVSTCCYFFSEVPRTPLPIIFHATGFLPKLLFSYYIFWLPVDKSS